MADAVQVVSADAGNGGVKAALSTPKGFKTFYMPSVRAVATGDTLGLGKEWEMQYDYVDWYGYRYVTGDDVTRVTRRGIERHIGADRYGNEFHQFLIAVALANLGIQSGSVDLTLFAPPGLYNEIKPFVLERFAENKGEVSLRLKGDKKPRLWRYENVTVWPEGIGAAACFVLDDNGQFAPSDAVKGDLVVVDVGVHTLDVVRFVNGNFNPESLQHATWEAGGVQVHIREPILRDLKKRGGDDFSLLTVDDVDRVIRLGSVSGDYMLAVAGKEVDMKPLLDKYRARYAEWIGNTVISAGFDNLRGIRGMVVVGGAGLVEDHLRAYYGDKVMNLKDYPTTKKVHPIDMNSVGGMRLALARLNKKASRKG